MLMGGGGGVSQHLRPLDPPQGAQKRGSVPKRCTPGGHRRGGEGDIEQSDPDAADGGGAWGQVGGFWQRPKSQQIR